MIFDALYYSFPDAAKLALELAKNFNPALKGVQPHVYQDSEVDIEAAGLVGDQKYFNLRDFDHDTLPDATKRPLFYGDFVISLTTDFNNIPDFYIDVELMGYPTRDTVNSASHCVYVNDRPENEFVNPMSKVFTLKNVFASWVEFNVDGYDAASALSLRVGVQFTGFMFVQ